MNKEILRLAIPNILSNLSVPLLSSVDTALMGHLSELHIGAVGVGSMLFNIIYWNFVFLRMGTTGITAQAYGKASKAEMVHTLARAITVVTVISLLILLLQGLIGQAGFYWMNVADNQQPFVSRYFFIRIWAVPATLGMYVFFGWYLGMQNAIFPLLLTLAINVINIVLSFLLVYRFDMDVDGVAWATVIAQYSGLLFAFGLFFYKYRHLLHSFKFKLVLEINSLKRFLVINSDIFVRTLCLTAAYGIFFSQASIYGSTILAVNVILLQFIAWMTYAMDGFAFAAESLVGKYTGAQNRSQLFKAMKYSVAWGVGVACLFSISYGLFGKLLLPIFTSDAELMQSCHPYLIWVIIFPLAAVASFMLDGIFIGLTASKSMRNSMAFALIFFLEAFYIFNPGFGNHGLWLAFSVFLLSRGLVQGIMFWNSGTRLN